MGATDREATTRKATQAAAAAALPLVANEPEASSAAPATVKQPANKQAARELLCTICGLRACWLEPGQEALRQ